MLGGLGGILTSLTSGSGGLFPNNSLITEYGINSAELFKVKMTAYQPVPPKITSKGGGISAPPEKPTELCSLTVLYQPQAFQVNHAHTWGQTGLGEAFQSLAAAAGGMTPFGLGGGAATIQSIIDNKGLVGASVHTATTTFGDLDIPPVYQGSGEQTMNIQFVLMAHANPVTEVCLPAQLITYLTYPKIEDGSEFISKLTKLGQAGISMLGGAASDIIGSISDDAKQIADDAKQNIDKLAQNAAEIVKGSARFRVGKAPPMWVVSCSNGSQYMGNAHVESINVTYYGPWLGAPKNPLSSIAGVAGLAGGIGGMASAIFPGATAMPTDILSSLLSGGQKNGGFPSYATVNITFKSNFKVMFGEEWLLSFAKSDVGVGGFGS